MNEILHDADLIVRGQLCGCPRCKADADVPTVRNCKEKSILKRLHFAQKEKFVPFTEHWRKDPQTGEWKNVK